MKMKTYTIKKRKCRLYDRNNRNNRNNKHNKYNNN